MHINIGSDIINILIFSLDLVLVLIKDISALVVRHHSIVLRHVYSAFNIRKGVRRLAAFIATIDAFYV
jgi:hypothetical protein